MGNKCYKNQNIPSKERENQHIEEENKKTSDKSPNVNIVSANLPIMKISIISQEENHAIIPTESFLLNKIYDFFPLVNKESISLNTYKISINKSVNDEFIQFKKDENLQIIMDFHKSMKLSRSLQRSIPEGMSLSLRSFNKSIQVGNVRKKSPPNSARKFPKSVFAEKKASIELKKFEDSILMSGKLVNRPKPNEIMQELKRMKEKYLKMNFKDLELLESLGEIPNGTLFKCYDKINDEILQIKFLMFEKEINKNWEDNEGLWELMKEKNILEKLSNLNLDENPFLLLKSMYENDDHVRDLNQKTLLFITQSGRASLDQTLKARGSYSEKEISYIVYKIICGLSQGHEQLRICHRSISLDKIVFIEKKDAIIYKLGGFENAVQLNPDENENILLEDFGIEDLIYAAPELQNLTSFQPETYNPFKADVYSLGIVILEMMGFDKKKILEMKNGKFKHIDLEYEKKYPLLLLIIYQMLQENPSQRPTWESIMMKFKNVEKSAPNEETYLKDLKDKMMTILDEKTLKDYEDFCIIYFDLGQWNLAIEYINKALDLLKEKWSEAQFDQEELQKLQKYQWEFLDYKAIVSRESGQFSEALILHNKSLEIQYSLALNKDNLDIAATYERIGIVYKLMHDYKNALKYFESSLQIKQNIIENSNISIAQIMTEIGLIYRYLGNPTKAMENLAKALEISEFLLGNSNILLATYHTNIGDCFHEQNNWDMALKHYQKALEIRIDFLGEDINNEIIAKSYLSFAVLYENRGEFANAIDFHKKALEIRQKIADNDENLANSYIYLGNMYNETGDLQAALEIYEKALELRIKKYGENSEKTCVCYNNIGRISQNLGKVHDALNNHQKALAIRMSLFGLQHEETSFSLLNVGIAHQDLGNYPKAEENIEAALGVRWKIYGEYGANTAICYASLANVYQDTGNYIKAIEFHEKALLIRRKFFGENNAFTAISLTYLAQCLIEKGVYQKAMEMNERSCEILKNLCGENNLMTCVSFSTLGYNYFKVRDLEKALQIQKNVLEWRIKLFGEKSRYISVSQNNLGETFKEMGKYDESHDLHLKALNLRLSLLGEFHPETAQSYENLSIVSRLMNKGKEEKTYKGKAENIKKKLGIHFIPIKY